jgi:DNA-binding NarL/FixJ family response regulator
MSISISPSTPSLAATTPSPNTAPAQKAQVQQPASNNGGDTVKLTESQQIYQLYNQGRTVSQIASSLNLAVSAVDNYLNISSS